MDDLLEERYFRWLYDHIGNHKQRQPNMTYWNLARQLHKKEFLYDIANDDNRWEDGIELRNEFQAKHSRRPISAIWLGLGCSMLEMLIALSNRLEFQTDGVARLWFWHLMENIGIAQFNDEVYDDKAAKAIDEAMERVILRTYSYSGEGGLFPLTRADRDQRELEIWFQMHSYLLEDL